MKRFIRMVHLIKIDHNAGIGIYFKNNDELNFSAKIDVKSNNQAELAGIYYAIKYSKTNNLIIYTDSQISLLCLLKIYERKENIHFYKEIDKLIIEKKNVFLKK